MLTFTFGELGDRVAEIAEALTARGSLFVEFEKAADSYRLLLALGPSRGDLAFVAFGRNVAIVLPIGAHRISAEYLAETCPDAARGDLEPLAVFVSWVFVELRKSSS